MVVVMEYRDNIGLDMDRLLYRIINGRLPFKVGDLNLYIEYPSSSLLFDSYEVYQDEYNLNYMNEILTLQEMNELIVEFDLWKDSDERLLLALENQSEELKLQAFRVHYDTKKLLQIKEAIQENEKRQLELIGRKNQLTHMTCESIATNAQWLWLIEHTTFYAAKRTLYDWNEITPKRIIDFCDENSISSKEFRQIARSGLWRQMWAVGKKVGQLFNRPVSEMSKDQLTLCSFSIMYDNVYESPDCPSEKIICDDDCLDGWFIDQKNKNEESKKKSKISSISDKMNNASELYIVAQSPEHAQYINDMNTTVGKKIKASRKDLIDKKGVIYGDSDFNKIKEPYNG